MRWALFFCLAGVGCADPFPSSDVVVDLRIVSIVAEPPQAPPGSTVRLTAYIAYPQAPDQVVNVSVGRCNEVNDLEGTFDCEPSEETILTPDGAVALASPLSQNLYVYTFDYTIDSQIFTGHSPLATQCGFQDVLLVHAWVDGQRIDGLKRILVKASAPDSNQNPVLGSPAFSVTDGDLAVVSMVTLDQQYTATPTTEGLSAPEVYDVCRYDGVPETQAEEFTFTWQCTNGCTIDSDTTYIDADTGPQPPMHVTPVESTQSPFTIYMVLRDGRGGEAFSVIDLPLQSR